MKCVGIHCDGLAVWVVRVAGAVVEEVVGLRMEEAGGGLARVCGADAWIVSGLDADRVLIRMLDFKIKNRGSVIEALPFQLEGLLPFSADQAIVLPFFQSGGSSTQVHLVATKQSDVAEHLAGLEAIDVAPEQISCSPKALMRAAHFFTGKAPSLMLHIGMSKSLCGVASSGTLVAAQPISIGIHHLMEALGKDRPDSSPEEIELLARQLDLCALDEFAYPSLFAARLRLQKEIDRALAFLTQKSPSEELFLSGTLFLHFNLSAWLKIHLESSYTLQNAPASMSPYAISLGLALDALSTDGSAVQFRQGPFLNLHTVKKKLSKTLRFLTISSAASFVLVAGVWATLAIQKNHLSKTIQTLSGIEPSGEFENDLDRWEKLLVTQKQPFPFHPTVPSAREMLAWLSTLPAMSSSFPGERIDITHFDYALVKYPKLSEQSVPYTARVEIRITAPSTHLANLFLEALKRGDHIINTKDLTWKAEQNIYLASFSLKTE